MLELVKTKKENDGYFSIVIDSQSISKAWAYKSHINPNSPFQYTAEDKRSSWVLASQTIEDFEPFQVISLNNLFSWMIDGHSIIISPEFDEDENKDYLSMAFYFSPKLTTWDMEFSFAEFYREFYKICDDTLSFDYDLTFDGDAPALRFEVWFDMPPSSLYSIESILSSFEDDLRKTHEKTVDNLLTKIGSKLIRVSFDFPEEIKVSCEQYLLYFATFLRDLGINAIPNLKEEAGKVLFSVTPTDNFEALDKIREALAVYLKLPESPVVFDDSFKSMRTQQQIENLQHSQKMMVRELQINERLLVKQSNIIGEKNITISQLQSGNEQLIKIIEKITSNSIMMDSVENKEELEEIFDGLKVGESKFLKEQIGIHFNPATFVKGVGKSLIGKDDEITSLNLDKVTDKENN